MPPAETADRQITAMVVMSMIEGSGLRERKAGSCRAARPDDFHRVERGCEPLLLTKIAGALPEARTADAGRAVRAHDPARRVLTRDVVEDQILCRDDIAFHADHLRHMCDAA